MPFSKCPNCGKVNSVKLAKCPKCGYLLQEIKPSVSAFDTDEPPTAPVQPASPFGGAEPTPTPAPSPFGSAEPTPAPVELPKRKNPYYTGG